MPAPPSLPIAGQVHHYGYVVDDLDRAMQQFVSQLGAGPFVVMRNVPVENVTSHGEPAVFSHSSAFAQCADITIELMEMYQTAPDVVEAAFRQPRPSLHHVAWVTPDLDAGITVLAEQGLPQFLRAGLGDIAFSYHDGRHLLGHHVELHHDSAGLRGFFDMIRDARQGWDGSDPVRSPSF